jgi:hypothetical protein
MNKTIIYLIGYERSFKEHCNTGWGCGYVMIPTTHKLVIDWKAQIAKPRDENDEEDHYRDFYDRYLTPPNCGHEITYTEEKMVNGIEYVVIGFDTAHSFNGPQHDFDWVFNQTVELQQVVDACA